MLDPTVLAEVDLGALAETSGITLERLEEISSGADPSVYELGEIAEAVEESPMYLVRPRPAIVARRDSGVDNASMDRLLERFDRHVAAFRKELGQDPPPTFPVTTAWRARRAGQLWAQQHDIGWIGIDAPDPLFEVIENQLRIPVLVYPVPQAPFGATLRLHETVVIWVNSHGAAGSQQRFTLAHELAHIMLRHLDVSRIEQVESPEQAPHAGSALQRTREEHANAFAGGVLYDRDRVLAHWDGEETPVTIARIAVGLGISFEAATVAMKIHLKEEIPTIEAAAQATSPARAFLTAGHDGYLNWYQDRRDCQRLPENLERLDLLERALPTLAVE